MSTAHVSRLINRELVALRDELLAYSNEADLWKVPKGVPNSAGNLALHLAYHLGQIDYHRRVVTGNTHSVGALPLPAIALPK